MFIVKQLTCWCDFIIRTTSNDIFRLTKLPRVKSSLILEVVTCSHCSLKRRLFNCSNWIAHVIFHHWHSKFSWMNGSKTRLKYTVQRLCRYCKQGRSTWGRVGGLKDSRGPWVKGAESWIMAASCGETQCSRQNRTCVCQKLFPFLFAQSPTAPPTPPPTPGPSPPLNDNSVAGS